jgi:hypothetical protein
MLAFKYNLRTTSSLDKPCIISGTQDNVEMHHRRPLKSKETDAGKYTRRKRYGTKNKSK